MRHKTDPAAVDGGAMPAAPEPTEAPPAPRDIPPELAPSVVAPPPPRRTVAAWQVAKGVSDLWHQAARVHYNWPVGAELTEAAYDAAIATVRDLKAG